MSINWIFHALAIIFGIIAAACGLLSSQNKLTLFIVFSLVAAIFELSIPLLKAKPIEKPLLKFFIDSDPLKYQKGVIVEGIEWQPDFKKYSFNFKNESKVATINDLRIDLDTNGGVVKKEINVQQGCETISLSQAGISDLGIGNRDIISKTIKTYVNNIKINISKIYPKGYFNLIFIVKVDPLTSNTSSLPPGYLFIDYRCKTEKEELKKISIAYPIIYKNIEERMLLIDKSNPLKGQIKRSIKWIPDKPIVFKKNGGDD